MWVFNKTNTIWNRFLTFADDILCRDTDLVRRIGAATAREVKASGIHYNFAPCVAVRNRNKHIYHASFARLRCLDAPFIESILYSEIFGHM
jgi:hypothetical protein